jgi:hypothetical protein
MLKCTSHVDRPIKVGEVKIGDNHWHIWINHPIRNFRASPPDTEADARAKMLIYLLENKLVTV